MEAVGVGRGGLPEPEGRSAAVRVPQVAARPFLYPRATRQTSEIAAGSAVSMPTSTVRYSPGSAWHPPAAAALAAAAAATSRR